MSDRERILDVLQQIEETVLTIQRRFKRIDSPKAFTDSPEGKETLDGICMLLLAIGEGVKNLDRFSGGALLARYPEIDWKGVMGLRDIISHHYFDIDVEEIFFICDHHLSPLATDVRKMIEELTPPIPDNDTAKR